MADFQHGLCMPWQAILVDNCIMMSLSRWVYLLQMRRLSAAEHAHSALQVHKAKLWTGETVAVKVQYPGLGASVTADLAVLTGLARAAEWLFPDGFRFEWILAELRQNLRTELDFRVEATNSERLRNAIGSHTSITVPAIIREVWQGPLAPTL